jgi:hypothetical protein
MTATSTPGEPEKRATPAGLPLAAAVTAAHPKARVVARVALQPAQGAADRTAAAEQPVARAQQATQPPAAVQLQEPAQQATQPRGPAQVEWAPPAAAQLA